MNLRWLWVGLGYALLAVFGVVLALWVNDADPLWHPSPAVVLSPWLREGLSCVLGALFAAVVIVATRALVAHAAWARALHQELRPVSVGMSTPLIVLLAALSALGEELFFRGFLTPWIGVIAQALVFGAAHQIRGPSRWWWMGWAAFAGLALGLLYWGIGTLSGPVLAHALINAVNLAYLRDHDVTDRPTRLGGLLRT